MQEIQKDFKPLVAKLREFADTENLSDIDEDELRSVLREASQDIENLCDFSINLVDDDGNVIFQISDEQSRELMFTAVDSFIAEGVKKRDIMIPDHLLGEVVPTSVWDEPWEDEE